MVELSTVLVCGYNPAPRPISLFKSVHVSWASKVCPVLWYFLGEIEEAEVLMPWAQGSRADQGEELIGEELSLWARFFQI